MCVDNRLVKVFKIANFIDGVRRAREIDYTESVYRKDGSLRKGFEQFFKCVIHWSINVGNFSKNFHYVYSIENIMVGSPEQFGFVSRYAKNMCQKNNCDICPFPILVKWREEFSRFDKVCPAIVGSYCPVMLMACNYRHECPGQQACQLYAIIKDR